MSPALAKPFSQFDPETQDAIRAAVENVQDYHYFIEYANGPVKEWTVWLCFQRKQKWPAFCHYTVEDYETHYRVRGDGRFDRWRTVQKRRK